jgi:hypothetical protein
MDEPEMIFPICQGCGKEFRIDIMVPDELWDRLKPPERKDGSGMLCGSCILTRMEGLAGADMWQLTKPLPTVRIVKKTPRPKGC